MSSNITHTTILHEGVVISVRGSQAEVLITRSSACEACAAASLCHSAQGRQTVVSATCEGGFVPFAGDHVVVEATVGQGLRATLMAYVVPLVLMVVVLALAIPLLGSEALAALVALVVLAVYYVALHFMGRRMCQSLSFIVKGNIN